MIHSLTGTVSGRSDTTLLIETDGGIEWMLQVSATTASDAPPIGNQTRVHTFLHHRDDQMALYGFSTQEERTMFLDLLRVAGIGPKQALRILSGLTVQQLVASLDAQDVDSLARVPGLGKKTAQKILLTLRGKLTLASSKPEEPRDELVDALIEMGFDRAKAQTAVSALRDENKGDDEKVSSGEVDEGELLKRAIVLLSGRQ